jgi:hypothetical protein
MTIIGPFQQLLPTWLTCLDSSFFCEKYCLQWYLTFLSHIRRLSSHVIGLHYVPMESGVPQVSVLDPSIFIYILWSWYTSQPYWIRSPLTHVLNKIGHYLNLTNYQAVFGHAWRLWQWNLYSWVCSTLIHILIFC